MTMKQLLLATVMSTGLAFSFATSAQASARDDSGILKNSSDPMVQRMYNHNHGAYWNSEDQAFENSGDTSGKIRDAERTVYFDSNKSGMMRSESLKLDSLASIFKPHNDIRSIQIISYSDRTGTRAANERISERRMETVETYMRKRGYLQNTAATKQWSNTSNTTQCSSGLSEKSLSNCLQNDRRVTVQVTYEKDES